MDGARASDATIWHSEVFTDTAQLHGFLNSLRLEPSQIASVQFALATPNTWRILLVCRLTPEQDQLRREWAAAEATIRGRRQELPVGGGH